MDFWKHIIPNELIYAGFAIYILAMCSYHDIRGLAGGVLRAVMLFICLFPAYRIKAIGAGDVKLLMMTGLFLSGEHVTECVIAAFVLGTVQGCIKLICRKTVSLKHHEETKTPVADNKIHFSLPVCLSVLLKLGGVY